MHFLKKLIGNKTDSTHAHYIHSLILMANVDGEYHSLEHQLLERIAKEKRISRSALVDIKAKASLTYSAPDDFHERFSQLFIIIRMMMADHKIRDEERLFCHHLASLLRFQQGVVRELITSIELNILAGNSVSETQRRVESLLKFDDIDVQSSRSNCS